MNKIELMGRMVKEIEIKKGKETKYGIFTLAVGRKENKEITDFVDCVAFGKLAETIATYTEKGNRIIVSGAIHFDKYQDKEGNTKQSVKVIVNDFYFVDFKTKRNEDTRKDVETTVIDELPF